MASLGLASSRLCSGLTASTSERSPACISLRRSSALRFRGSLSSVSQHSRSSTSSAAAQAPSSSKTLPHAIDGLSDQQRHQLAAEWGYEQLGAPLPSGITPAVLTQSMPLEVALIDEKRALLGVLAPIALMAAGYGWLWYMHTIIPGWQQALCWLMVGTGYFGLFVVAHDAARLALLPDNTELQNALGSLLMAPSLYSLEAWRVSLLIHYNQTNMLGEDAGAWQPLTKRRLAAMGKLQRQWAQLVSTTPLKLLGSICHWVSSWGNFDLKRYFAPLRPTMIASWSVPFWFMAIVWPALICCGGFAAWFDCWLMPWLVFHLWLSTITLLHHTAPHIPFEAEGRDYDAAQAIVNGTVTVSMPRWLEFVLNNANYDLPQHIYSGIPFYQARKATEAMKRKLGPFMTTANINGKLLRNLIEKWQVYDEDKKTYVTFQQAAQEVDAAISQPAAAAAAP